MSNENPSDSDAAGQQSEQDEKLKIIAVSHLLQHFHYEHLPAHLQVISKPVGDLAYQMADDLPENPETTAGLRKLLEAKDCFVRAALAK